MELTFKGGNCVVLSSKQATIVFDDNLKALGLSGVKKADVQLLTNHNLKGELIPDAFLIDGPGEYEVKEASVKGIPARAHLDTEGELNATIYTVIIGGTKVAVLGHIHPDLSDDDLEAIGMVDILVVPVGGNGYTLDSVGAAKMIKAIDPKIVIPTHYADKGVKYEVPQAEVADFLKEIGSEGEKLDKLKLKGDILLDKLTVYLLDRV